MKNEIELDNSITSKSQLLTKKFLNGDQKPIRTSSQYDVHREIHQLVKIESRSVSINKQPSLQELHDTLAIMSLHQKCSLLLKSIQEVEVQETITIIDHFLMLPQKPKLREIYDSKQQTLLHIACFKSCPVAVEKLLIYEKSNSTTSEFKQWVDLKNKDTFTAVHFAAYVGSIKTLEILKKFDVDLTVKNEQGQNALSIAAQGDQVSAMVWLYLQGLSYMEKDEKGGTPLHWATYYGSEFAVQFLLSWLTKSQEGKQIISQQDAEGMTPLHLAAMTGNSRIVKKLLYKGANKDIKDNRNCTPAQTAKENDYENIYKIMASSNCFYEFLNIRASYKPASVSWSQIISFFILYFYCMICSIVFVYPFFENDYWLQYLSIVSFLLGLVFYFLTMFVSPGYVEKNQNSEKLFELLVQYEPWELCPECQIHKPLRSRHCEFCQRCVIVYDHHCPWLNNCIGARNYPYFICFILTILFNLLHLIALNAYFVAKRYNNITNSHYNWFEDDYTSQNLFIIKVVLETLVLLICGFFLFPLIYLIWVQMDNLFKNTTTFEKYRQEEQSNTNNKNSKDKKSQTVDSHSSLKSLDKNKGCSCNNCVQMCCLNQKNQSYQH